MRDEARQVVFARVWLWPEAPEQVDLPVVNPRRKFVHSQGLLSGRVQPFPSECVEVKDEGAVGVLLHNPASLKLTVVLVL